MTPLRVTVASNRGLVRESNQDRVVVGPWILAPDRDGTVAISLDASDGLVAVIDGMGGHAGGELAATIAAEIIASFGHGTVDVDALAGIAQAANRAIYDRMEGFPAVAGMGAALACVAVDDEDLLVLNVGDVRAYLINDGYLIQLSVDDLAPGGSLTASLGGRARFEGVEPHVLREPAGGMRVLLASDGLTGAVDLEALEALVVDDDVLTITRMLDAVIAAGAPDNTSIVLLRPITKEEDHEQRWESTADPT